MRAALALGLALVALGGCKLFRHDPGRVVVVDGKSAPSRLVAKHVDGKADDVVSVGASFAVPYPGGEGAVTLGTPDGTLLRLEKDRSTNVPCHLPTGAALGALDAQGERLLFTTTASPSRETIHFMDLRSCAETTLETRSAYRGDVAPDGSEAAVGAFPTTCAEKSLNNCPITLYRLRPAGSPVPTEVIRGGPRAHYQPRYFPDKTLVFQTTELDAACDGTVNACRHDLVAMPIDGGPTTPLRTMRRGAISASVGRDGKRFAYLAYTGADTKCSARLPCKAMTLEVGDWRASDASKDVAIEPGAVTNVVPHAFSLDGRWIAFTTGDHHDVEICRVDGTSCRPFPETHLVGWMK